MAFEQWKKTGVIIGGVGLIVTVLCGMIGFTWASSGRFTAYDKDIKALGLKASTDIQILTDNQIEDRQVIEKIVLMMSKLEASHAEDVKVLTAADAESRLRDAQEAEKYQAILNHMSQQTEQGKRFGASISVIQVDVGKMQAKMGTLIKDK